MKKLSVIIPVYRAGERVLKCLDSLRNQTLKDIEIIFVDDHGDDNTMELLREEVKRGGDDNVVFTCTPQNSGPGCARNVGISLATGEYIGFVDADDWVEKDMYKVLYDKVLVGNVSMSCAEAVMDYPDGTHKYLTNPPIERGKKYLLTHFISNFTTCLFKRTLLQGKGIVFPTAHSGEDSCFMACCYLCAERIAQVKAPFYHYVIHTDSISQRKFVWRGKEKRKAFKQLFIFAKRWGYMDTYRWQLYWIYIKKALITPIIEYLKSV